jgi:flagellar motor switch protein FliN/FliY
MNAQTSNVKHLQLADFDGEAKAGERLWSDSMEVIKDVQVKLQVSLGETKLSVADVMDLREHSVVKLDRDASAPVELILNGKIVARGSLVVVGDSFGVRLTELDNP